MGKRKLKSKRSVGSLPKGLPIRGNDVDNSGNTNPFEIQHRMKKPKFDVHNRGITSYNSNGNKMNALALALDKRKSILKQSLQQSKKNNTFNDLRIGIKTNTQLSIEEQNLARLVRERANRSKKLLKYSLNDDNDNDYDGGNDYNDSLLTHRGKSIDTVKPADHELVSDDDDDDNDGKNKGNLDATDTMFHFGGGVFDKEKNRYIKEQSKSIYGPTTTTTTTDSTTDGTSTTNAINQLYGTDVRKLELDDLIIRRKLIKADKIKLKDEQHTTFDQLDTNFKELASMLSFRDKTKDSYTTTTSISTNNKSITSTNDNTNKNSKLDQVITKTTNNSNYGVDDDVDDYDEWDKEMKQYLYNTTIKKVKATDRTKTVEEIAKDEYDTLHELEQRRLARMNNDFSNDTFDDVDNNNNNDNKNSDDDSSDDDNDDDTRKKSQKKGQNKNNDTSYGADQIDYDSDNDSNDNNENNNNKLQTHFTSEGLVYLDQDGNIVGKVGDIDAANELKNKKKMKQQQTSMKNNEVNESLNQLKILQVGMRVRACYHAKEQYIEQDDDNDDADNEDNNNTNSNETTTVSTNRLQLLETNASWYNGTIAQVNTDDNTTYNIDYDDGDYENNIERQYIKVIDKSYDEIQKEVHVQTQEVLLKKKQQLATEKARTEIPYMFEVPTTLDALHDIIGQYASTGADVTLIIQRIHKVNSVRLDHRNMEKMQNFYDLLLRRFIAVGDAIYKSGDGGNELCRYKQLDALTVTLYEMAQESPEIAASVWSRRLGILHKAHAKRLRDAEYNISTVDDESAENDYTTWPSTGVILLLRTIGHIFPVTDKKHPIVTPLIIFLSQILTSTPLLSKYDLVAGLLICGILIEYTKDAKRIIPEVNAFLACVIRMFAGSSTDRLDVKHYSLPPFSVAAKDEEFINLRQEMSRIKMKDSVPLLTLEKTKVTLASILFTAMHFVDSLAQTLHPVLKGSDKEAFADITESILCLHPKLKSCPLPKALQMKLGTTVSVLSTMSRFDQPRVPIQRRLGESTKGVAIKSLAPRIENPERYSLSKDKGKSAAQSAADRTRREYKREHKAVARELRLDNTFIETERRVEEKQKTDTARAKRNKAYAWLEGEQGAMNQQIRQGGGLLQGGGTGAAKIKARTGKMGIKKGGKF